MNEHLYTTDDGLRLIQEFEGAPRLKARLCEGGAWELSYGVTFRPDGTRIREGETCSESEAMMLFRHALGVFEQAVRDMVTVPLEPHQFSALVAWVYNIGIENARSSTVLREVNANRVYDAAAAFGMWIYATKNEYKQALRGLLRRRYAEACLFLGYQWSEACADEAIALQRERPTSLPGKDKVIYKTPFKDVLAVAQHYPLDASPEPAYAQVPVLLPTEPARIEAPVASLPDSPAGVPLDDIPTQLPLPDPIEDELFLDTPAATEETSVSKGSPPVSEPPSPSSQAAVPSHVNETAKSEHDEGVVSKIPPKLNTNPAASPAGSPGVSLDPLPPKAPKASPASPVPAPAPPKPPPVIAPKSIDIRSIPYGEMDPEQPPKNMTDSRRVIGMVVVGAGSLVQILAAREIVSSSVGAIFFDMSRDPVVVALFAGACMWVVGWLTRKRGTHIVAKGMVEATSLLK